MAWGHFVEFSLHAGRANPATLGHDAPEAERLLVYYIQRTYDDNGSFTHAKYAVLAMQTVFRQHRGLLRGAWDSIESWESEREANLRKPLPILVLRAMAGIARMLAWEARMFDVVLALEWLLFSILLELGFYALLRPGELTALTSIQICCSEFGEDGPGWASLAILRPKNRRFMGRLQYACVRSVRVSQWLAVLTRLAPGRRVLWPWGPRRFGMRFAEVTKLLGLERCGFTAASLRAGGATWYFQNGTDPSRLKYMGRWKSEFSAAHYLQESSGTFILGQLSAPCRARLQHIATLCDCLASITPWLQDQHGRRVLAQASLQCGFDKRPLSRPHCGGVDTSGAAAAGRIAAADCRGQTGEGSGKGTHGAGRTGRLGAAHRGR